MQADHSRPFQFSLRSLMLAVLVASLALSVWKSLGIHVALMLGIQSILVAPFIIADVKAHSGSPQRAFLRFTVLMIIVILVPWLALGSLVLFIFLIAIAFA